MEQPCPSPKEEPEMEDLEGILRRLANIQESITRLDSGCLEYASTSDTDYQSECESQLVSHVEGHPKEETGVFPTDEVDKVIEMMSVYNAEQELSKRKEIERVGEKLEIYLEMLGDVYWKDQPDDTAEHPPPPAHHHQPARRESPGTASENLSPLPSPPPARGLPPPPPPPPPSSPTPVLTCSISPEAPLHSSQSIRGVRRPDIQSLPIRWGGRTSTSGSAQLSPGDHVDAWPTSGYLGLGREAVEAGSPRKFGQQSLVGRQEQEHDCHGGGQDSASRRDRSKEAACSDIGGGCQPARLLVPSPAAVGSPRSGPGLGGAWTRRPKLDGAQINLTTDDGVSYRDRLAACRRTPEPAMAIPAPAPAAKKEAEDAKTTVPCVEDEKTNLNRKQSLQSIQSQIIKVFCDDKTMKSFAVSPNLDARTLRLWVLAKCNLLPTLNWSLVLLLIDNHMEREFEEDELILSVLNKLHIESADTTSFRILLTNRPIKQDLFLRPEHYLLEEYRSSGMNLPSSARRNLLEDFLTSPSHKNNLLNMQGILWYKLKGAKKNWKKGIFALRSACLYQYVRARRGEKSPGRSIAKTKGIRQNCQLQLTASLDCYQAFTGEGWPSANKAPTDFCFALAPKNFYASRNPEDESGPGKQAILMFSAISRQSLFEWWTAIRVVLVGKSRLWTHFVQSVYDLRQVQKTQTKWKMDASEADSLAPQEFNNKEIVTYNLRKGIDVQDDSMDQAQNQLKSKKQVGQKEDIIPIQTPSTFIEAKKLYQPQEDCKRETNNLITFMLPNESDPKLKTHHCLKNVEQGVGGGSVRQSLGHLQNFTSTSLSSLNIYARKQEEDRERDRASSGEWRKEMFSSSSSLQPTVVSNNTFFRPWSGEGLKPNGKEEVEEGTPVAWSDAAVEAGGGAAGISPTTSQPDMELLKDRNSAPLSAYSLNWSDNVRQYCTAQACPDCSQLKSAKVASKLSDEGCCRHKSHQVTKEQIAGLFGLVDHSCDAISDLFNGHSKSENYLTDNNPIFSSSNNLGQQYKDIREPNVSPQHVTSLQDIQRQPNLNLAQELCSSPGSNFLVESGLRPAGNQLLVTTTTDQKNGNVSSGLDQDLHKIIEKMKSMSGMCNESSPHHNHNLIYSGEAHFYSHKQPAKPFTNHDHCAPSSPGMGGEGHQEEPTILTKHSHGCVKKLSSQLSTISFGKFMPDPMITFASDDDVHLAGQQNVGALSCHQLPQSTGLEFKRQHMMDGRYNILSNLDLCHSSDEDADKFKLTACNNASTGQALSKIDSREEEANDKSVSNWILESLKHHRNPDNDQLGSASCSGRSNILPPSLLPSIANLNNNSDTNCMINNKEKGIQEFFSSAKIRPSGNFSQPLLWRHSSVDFQPLSYPLQKPNLTDDHQLLGQRSTANSKDMDGTTFDFKKGSRSNKGDQSPANGYSSSHDSEYANDDQAALQRILERKEFKCDSSKAKSPPPPPKRNQETRITTR